MVVETGRFTGNVEVKKVKHNGEEISVLNNRLAIRQGKDNTVFIDVTFWGQTADFVGSYFSKGDEIFVEGELRQTQIKLSEDKVVLGVAITVRSVKPTFGKVQKQNEQEANDNGTN